MKFIIQLSAILIILSSCAALSPVNGKMRLVRTGNNEEVQVVEREPKTLKMKVEEVQEIALAEEKRQDLKEVVQLKAEELSDGVVAQEKVVTVPDESPSPDDLLPDEDERIANSALRAERDANSAFWLFISGLISVLIPYLGFIPFIIGLIYYSRSKNSRYITQWGQRRSDAATVLLVIDGVILTLWILFIVLIILVL